MHWSPNPQIPAFVCRCLPGLPLSWAQVELFQIYVDGQKNRYKGLEYRINVALIMIFGANASIFELGNSTSIMLFANHKLHIS